MQQLVVYLTRFAFPGAQQEQVLILLHWRSQEAQEGMGLVS